MAAWNTRSAGSVPPRQRIEPPAQPAGLPAGVERAAQHRSPGRAAGPDRVEHHRRRLVPHAPAVRPERVRTARSPRRPGWRPGARPSSSANPGWRHPLEVDREARAHDPRDVDRLVAELEQRQEVPRRRGAEQPRRLARSSARGSGPRRSPRGRCARRRAASPQPSPASAPRRRRGTADSGCAAAATARLRESDTPARVGRRHVADRRRRARRTPGARRRRATCRPPAPAPPCPRRSSRRAPRRGSRDRRRR